MLKMNKTVIGVGNAAFDYTGLCKFFPQADEKIRLSSLLTGGGGSCATAIVTCARLGLKTGFFSSIGDDLLGKMILDDLEKEGVNTEGIRINPGKTSPFAFCGVEEKSGQKKIYSTLGDSQPLKANDINEKTIAESSLLLLDGNHPIGAIRAAKIANSAEIPIVIDAGGMKERMEEVAFLGDFIIASFNYALAMAKSKDPQKALLALLEIYPPKPLLAITLGEKGCIAAINKANCKKKNIIFPDDPKSNKRDGKSNPINGKNKENDGKFSPTNSENGGKVADSLPFTVDKYGFYHISPRPIVAKDTTGAGDVFHGAFAFAIIRGMDVLTALCFAGDMAGIKCQELTARRGILSLEQARAKLPDYNL